MFKTKGDISEAEMIWPLLDGAEIGETVTYDQFQDALGRDLRESRSPIYTATRRLERERQRTTEAVENVGYRIVEPREHARLVGARHRKSQRQVRRGFSIARAADRSKLTREERAQIDALQERTSRLERMMRASDQRMKAMEVALRTTRATAECADERLTSIEEKLRERGLLD